MTATPLPSYLVQRYRGWKATKFVENKSWFKHLAESGQHPRAMVISCCDSRVHVTAIFGSDTGEFFIHRNIAALVPPFQPDGDHHGTSAAVEYAVTTLKVAHIIVVVGAAFAFGWTPCIGPVLGSILALSATEASISKGILLLSFYSLGLAIPFILSGYFMNSFLTSKKGFGKYYNRVTKIGGAVLLITGILIATNQIQVISYYILTTFPFLTSLG